MKLSSLTLEQKNRLLAELDSDKPILIFDYNGNFTLDYFFGGKQFMRRKQRYDLSYDSIIPLVQKLNEESREKILSYLTTFLKKDIISDYWKVTPSQICDAVLIATGKAEL